MRLQEFPKTSLLILFFAFLLVACCSSEKRKAKKALLVQDSSVYANQNYSALTIDSTLISSLVLQDQSLDSFYSLIIDFYRRRNFQAAWYATDSSFGTPARSFISRLNNYLQVFGDQDLLGGRLLFSGDSVELNPKQSFTITNPKPLTDILLTAAFFKYANHEYYGADKTAHDLEWYIPRKKKNYLLLLDALISSDKNYAAFEPLHPQYLALKKQLIHYRAIEKSGGWPIINCDSLLTVGDSLSLVSQIKKRLALTHDISNQDTTAIFSKQFEEAIINYQERMGIEPTGLLNEVTLHEINVSVTNRIKQLMINMERLRWAPDSIPENYLLVNIPEFKLHLIENNKELWDMKIIVGTGVNGTSIFSDRIRTLVFRPYWKVPQSIIVKEFLPILRRDPGYLYRQNMEVLSNGTIINPYSVNWSKYKKSVPFVIRQRPGSNNALGLILFLFPNQFDIYMHDTPGKSLFEANNRAFSHGCIRLADAEKLAKYLLRNEPYYNEERITRLMSYGNENRISLTPGMPVFISYFTAWVDANGRLNFRKDIYGLDDKLANEIFSH